MRNASGMTRVNKIFEIPLRLCPLFVCRQFKGQTIIDYLFCRFFDHFTLSPVFPLFFRATLSCEMGGRHGKLPQLGDSHGKLLSVGGQPWKTTPS